MKRSSDTLYKFLFFNITVFLFACIFVVGFIGMHFLEYVYSIDPMIVLVFYIILAFFDRWLTKKCMLSSMMIRWILSFGR